MASIRETVVEELQQCGVELSEVSLNKLLVDGDLEDGSQTYTKGYQVAVDTAILTRLDRLAAMPDVTESGMTLKWDRARVATYCNQLRNELGLSTSAKATIRNATNRW